MNKNVEPLRWTAAPRCRPIPFPIQDPWPFHLGEQCIVCFAEVTPDGCQVWGEWHPVDASPEGFILARLPYEVAGDVDRLLVNVAPILEAWMRTPNRDDMKDLMRSASLLCWLLTQHQTEQAYNWLERQYAGYEVLLMSKKDGG